MYSNIRLYDQDYYKYYRSNYEAKEVMSNMVSSRSTNLRT